MAPEIRVSLQFYNKKGVLEKAYTIDTTGFTFEDDILSFKEMDDTLESIILTKYHHKHNLIDYVSTCFTENKNISIILIEYDEKIDKQSKNFICNGDCVGCCYNSQHVSHGDLQYCAITDDLITPNQRTILFLIHKMDKGGL